MHTILWVTIYHKDQVLFRQQTNISILKIIDPIDGVPGPELHPWPFQLGFTFLRQMPADLNNMQIILLS